jgi:hypothetical protein
MQALTSSILSLALRPGDVLLPTPLTAIESVKAETFPRRSKADRDEPG